MNNSSYIHILFFPSALPRANGVDVESFVALVCFFLFFVLFLDFFFVFSDFTIYYTSCTRATHALYKMNNECVSLCCDFYLFVHTSCPSK